MKLNLDQTINVMIAAIIGITVIALAFVYYGDKKVDVSTDNQNATTTDTLSTSTANNTNTFKPYTQTKPSTPSIQNVTTLTDSIILVSYSEKGFNPSILTIKAGQKVRFINNSYGSMWVASDPHPSHSDYPEFDQLLAVEHNGTFDFTFTKTGTWKYHNHILPIIKGTVVVQ
jgi:plastocyanin